MFDHLSDPNPPEPDAGARALVGRRAQQLHRRSVAARSAVGALLVLLVVGGVVATGRRSTVPVDTASAPAGSVDGIVRSSDGPVPGALVQLVRPVSTPPGSNLSPGDAAAQNPWRIVATGETDPFGAYRIDNIDAGEYLVRVVDRKMIGRDHAKHDPAFAPNVPVASKARVVQVQSGSTTTVNVELNVTPLNHLRGVVSIDAQGSAGLPIANVTVRLFSGGELMRETKSDRGGAYDLGGVPEGTYTLAFVDEQDRSKGTGFPTRYRTTWYQGGDHPQAFTMPGEELVVNVRLDAAR